MEIHNKNCRNTDEDLTKAEHTVVSRPRPDKERIMDVQEGRSLKLGVGGRARPFCSYL